MPTFEAGDRFRLGSADGPDLGGALLRNGHLRWDDGVEGAGPLGLLRVDCPLYYRDRKTGSWVRLTKE